MFLFKISCISLENLKLLRKHFVKSLLGVLCVYASALQIHAEPQSETNGLAIELPEDFLTRLDGDKLKVSLESLDEIGSKGSLSNLLVRLIDSKGLEKTAVSNELGVAEFSNVEANELHALVVSEPNSHAAIPFITVGDEKASQKKIDSMGVRIPLIGVNKDEILASINGNIPPQKALAGSLYSLDDYQLQHPNHYQVRLQSDGSLNGRVIIASRDLPESLRYAKLTFFKDDKVVARADSNPNDGGFKVDGLSSGVYGVVAAGPAGYSAFSFDVMPPAGEPVLPAADGFGKPVSFTQAEPAMKLYVFLVPPVMSQQVTETVRETYLRPSVEPIANQPLGSQPSVAGYGPIGRGYGGGFGGGGSFGGGSGAGGGSGGGRFGIAALAGIGAVLAYDFGNDSNGNVASPITP